MWPLLRSAARMLTTPTPQTCWRTSTTALPQPWRWTLPGRPGGAFCPPRVHQLIYISDVGSVGVAGSFGRCLGPATSAGALVMPVMQKPPRIFLLVTVSTSHHHTTPFIPDASCAGRRSHPRTGKGRPPPGEKAKKKRARVEAKRAARAEHCGTDLAAIEAELRSFVLSRGDLKVLPWGPEMQQTCPEGGQAHSLH